MSYKVLITTSGTGSRLREFTAQTNKALVRIGAKPAISHIVELYPEDAEFVVTTGYYGNQVKDFLDLAYPDRRFTFVDVANFDGPGSSLGLSMLEAKGALQAPFIFHACDTLVTKLPPLPVRNWIGVHTGDDTTQYASWRLRDGKLYFNEKGAVEADFLHIGLIGVKDYGTFWKILGDLYAENPKNSTLNDCQTLSHMIERDVPMELEDFPVWHDIGNMTALQKARKEASDSPDDLYKPGESIFIFKDFVIKFFADAKVAENRTKRGKLLEGFVPKMLGAAGNFYKYEFVKGKIYPDVVTQKDFKEFLEWVETHFWREEFKFDKEKFQELCRTFYVDKTKMRIEQFLKANDMKDSPHIINGVAVPTLEEILAKVDFGRLSDGLQSRFHGDFILDNILKTPTGYALLDWRQDFAGVLDVGDRYYDLAKLNHNLTVNHGIINQGLYTVKSDGENVSVGIMRPSALVECQATLFDFLRKYRYDTRKVRFLTALVWLNMAPLHHHPFNLFLYYWGKLNLWNSLKENDIIRKI